MIREILIIRTVVVIIQNITESKYTLMLREEGGLIFGYRGWTLSQVREGVSESRGLPHRLDRRNFLDWKLNLTFVKRSLICNKGFLDRR